MSNHSLVEGLNFSNLTDEDLQERLQELGFNPGPILASTRGVYERKLARLLGCGDSFSGDLSDSEPHEDSEVHPSDTPNSFLSSPLSPMSNMMTPPYHDRTADFSTPSTSFNYEDLRRRPLPRLSDQMPYSTSPRFSSQGGLFNPDDIVSQVVPPPGELEKPMLSTKVKLAIAIALLFFAAIVYWNMESAPMNPFSK